MQMPGRATASGAYRYGFNGKENDGEINGWQDYGMREYDVKTGRFISLDPLKTDYPELTPYQFASNNPIEAMDLDGAEAQSSKKENENESLNPQQPSLLEKLDNLLLGGEYKHNKKMNVLDISIKQQTEEVSKFGNLKQMAMNGLLNSAPLSLEAKSNLELYNQYDKEQHRHLSSLKWLILQRYEAMGEGKAIQSYQDVLDKQLRTLVFGTNAMATAASFIPSGGTSAGLFASATEIRASVFSLRGGYGVFGKNGVRIGGYKIEALYASDYYGTGTLFSIKQFGKKGGNLLRWDIGKLHKSSGVGLHSSFRFNIKGKTFGSTNQYPWYAPFRYWKYPKN